MKRAALWAQLVQIAWERHRATSRELCQQAAALVLRDAWPLDTHRLYVIQQVEAQYALAESYVDDLTEVAPATARPPAQPRRRTEMARTRGTLARACNMHDGPGSARAVKMAEMARPASPHPRRRHGVYCARVRWTVRQ